ncbi:MAG: GGDEF domain-containing protein [Solirubrobacteraceae bacterium]|nr:GGDEF domain-containing protein [Solirubrobacteraceae bacterium]
MRAEWSMEPTAVVHDRHVPAYPAARTAREGDRPVELGESVDGVDRLLDDSWDERLVPFERRERAAGAAISAGFLASAVWLAVAAPAMEARAPVWVIALVAICFSISSRVEFPIGAGYAVPTQLFLVPLFVLAPPPLVPLIVVAAHAVATLVDVLRQRVRADRLVDVGVDSWHSVAPALVIIAVAPSSPGDFPWWAVLAAFSAQMLSEVATSTLREWLGSGIPPRLQIQVLVKVWAIDLLLTPLGVMAATSSIDGHRAAPVALMGVVILLAVVTRDRTQRIEQAHVRLEALRAERTRLEVAVQRIGDAFASKLDLDALLNITMRAAFEALDADGGRASANAGHGRRLVRRATIREDRDLEPALVAAEQAAALTGEVSVATVNDVSAVACPVREPSGDRQAAGVVTLARRSGGFTDRKQALLLYLCEQAGVASGDIERHTVLHRQALTDELTGLANHRRFQEVVSLGTDAYKLSGTPLALLLFDLDNFKQVNDTRGHQTGDHVLRAVSDVLRTCCRAGDEAARYGGEELAIVLHASELPAALAVAERARAKIAALQLVDTEGRDLTVTTSVGVAALGPGIREPRALIAAADAALYEAKHAGKNRVHFQAGTAAV